MLSTVVNGKKLNLIQTIDELRWLRKEIEKSKTVGVDTETSGLSFYKDKMVGLCITACRPMEGFYLPVRHVIGKNLPLGDVVELAQYAIFNKKTMFFNRNFDANMLEMDGCEIPYNADMHDVQVMCWEATNEKFPALKKYTRDYLKWKMMDFGEAAGTDEDGNANHNFGETDPEQSYIYAALDPIATVELGRHMWNTYPYIRKIYPVDNLVTEAVRRMGKVDVQIDYGRLEELSEEANKELRSMRQQIIQMVGYEFNIGSNRDKAEALSRFVTLSVKTKTGQFSVKDEVLQEIDHPLAQLLLNYSKRSKFINSFIKPLSLMKGKPVHFNFKTVEVPCLTEESNVHIKNKGIVSVKEVSEGDMIWTRFGWKKVTMAEKHFADETVKINMKSGISARGTLWHPLLRRNRLKKVWTKMQDLKHGHQIITNSICDFYENKVALHPKMREGYKLMDCSEELTPELARLIGFIDGDGSIVEDGVKLCFSIYEPELMHPYVHLMMDLFGVDEPKRSENNEDHTVQYKFCSVRLVDYFKGIGCRAHSVPDCILKGGTKIWLEYLRGYWDSDGTLCETKGRYQPRLKSKDFGRMVDVQRMLMFLGFETHFSPVSVNDKNPRYEVTCSGANSRKLFQELIGEYLYCDKKRERSTKRHLDASFKDEHFDMVDSVEMMNGAYVYHLEVEDVHEYIADGLVHHNTGRMAAGQVRGNDYYARLNVQALPKKKVHRYLHEGSDLGYFLDDNPEGALGDQEVKAGFRDCFVAPEGYVFVSADYCGEEINICANLSGDDTWCNAINEGKDIHMESAKKVFGIADKEKRGIVKTCSFLIIYGGGDFTLSRRLKVSLQEAKNMFNAFHVGMPKVSRWIKYTIDQARRKGILFTYYGRPRLLYQYYSSSDPKKHSFADRSAVNTLCQGCIPTDIHIELKGKAVYLASHLGVKYTIADGREAITSGRRTGQCYLILTKSGDFAIADENHGFIHGSKKKPLYRRVCEGLNVKIRTSKLQSKMFPNLLELKNLFTTAGRKKAKSTILSLSMKDEVVKNRRLSTYFFICWLLKLPLNFKDIHRAASMRSIASVFGFNLKIDTNSDIQQLDKADYYLHWFRKPKTSVVGVRKLGIENIGSLTMTSGHQIYPTQGFLNKNTGADIMRILLCKFFQEKNDNSEFNENAELGWHVHDEINVYVKKEYLFKFFYILRDLMWVRHPNWRTDLKSDIGIGTSWGNGINAIGVTPEGTLIIKGLNDTPEVMERTMKAVKAAGLKWDDDLGLKRI